MILLLLPPCPGIIICVTMSGGILIFFFLVYSIQILVETSIYPSQNTQHTECVYDRQVRSNIHRKMRYEPSLTWFEAAHWWVKLWDGMVLFPIAVDKKWWEEGLPFAQGLRGCRSYFQRNGGGQLHDILFTLWRTRNQRFWAWKWTVTLKAHFLQLGPTSESLHSLPK